MENDLPTGPDAERSVSLYASHEHYALLDSPRHVGQIMPPYLGSMVYLGEVSSILAVIVGHHPDQAAVRRRMVITQEFLEVWAEGQNDDEFMGYWSPADWWELLKLRAEAWPAYEAAQRERDQRRAAERARSGLPAI